jgi:hypothetical protein
MRIGRFRISKPAGGHMNGVAVPFRRSAQSGFDPVKAKLPRDGGVCAELS